MTSTTQPAPPVRMSTPRAAPLPRVPCGAAHAPVGRPADRFTAARARLPHRRRPALRHDVALPVPRAAPVGAVPPPDEGHALVGRGVPPVRGLVPLELPAGEGAPPARAGDGRPRSSSARRARTTCSTRRCPARIAQHLPDVKVIAILRDPVARAWSAYHHEYRRGYETLGFEEALDAEPASAGRRRAGARRRPDPAPLAPAPRLRRTRPLRRAARADVGPRRPRPLPRAVHRRPRARPGRRDAAGARLPRDPAPDPPPRPGAGTARTPPPITAELQARLEAAFAPSDAWLAEHLEAPPPWRT